MSLDASYHKELEYVWFRDAYLNGFYFVQGCGGLGEIKIFWWRGENGADDNTVRIGLLKQSS